MSERDRLLVEREQQVRTFQREVQSKEQQAQQLRQQQNQLQEQFSSAQSNAQALAQRLHSATNDALISKERLAAMQADLKTAGRPGVPFSRISSGIWFRAIKWC